MVVHLAAAKNRSVEMPEYRAGYEANLLGTLNLVEACQESTALTRFVYLGTCEEYGQQAAPFDESSREMPVSAYAVTKLAVTQLLQALARARGFPAIILRPTVVYGPGQNVDMFLSALIKSLVSGQRFGMTRGEQTRDFVFIDDMVNAIMRALVAPNIQGLVINVSCALPVRIDDLARKVARLVGTGAESLLDFGARECRQGEAMDYWASNSRAKALLDWSPNVLLDDGLRQTISSFRAEMLNG
jgi:nucleoside-diphosphate-sugar epimerase